ncbi:MAG: aminoglycoside phosphotransferase family protein [Angelakisella sp.]
MTKINERQALVAAAQFPFDGELVSVARYGSGHINDTFAVVLQQPANKTKRYILQRINSDVFRHPLEVQENIQGVTHFLSEQLVKTGGDPLRETLTMLLTKDGKVCWRDDEGEFWRVYLFIENTISYQLVKDANDFYESARSFGNFQRLLADYPAETLHETIANFHNTPDRLRQFREALVADKLGRAKEVQPEIDFVLSREQDCSLLVDQQKAGLLPLRVTHNDTKLNNILIDGTTGRGICVIDLDTVMPGLSAYDFGDSIRFGASSAEEDEQDLSKVHFVPALFDIYTKGYLEVAGAALTPAEIDSLRVGSKLMTLECGMRFLADHLNGDTYFKIHREGHNLDRARTQFKLVAEMEQRWDEMQQIVNKYRP